MARTIKIPTLPLYTTHKSFAPILEAIRINRRRKTTKLKVPTGKTKNPKP